MEENPVEGEEDIYEYTVTVHSDEGGEGSCGGHISLVNLWALLPDGYGYVSGSAALYDDEDQLSTDDPQWDSDYDAWQWAWGGSGEQHTGDDPNAPATRYQRFRVTGTGSHEGGYSWIEAKRQNIGIVGEITGTVYTITATAKLDEETTSIVKAVVLRQGEGASCNIEIISWEVNQ